jgi:hypothetical protein
MNYRRILLLAVAVAGALLLASQAMPAAADEGDGLIKAGDPTRDGSVDITIKCEQSDGSVETIDVSVAVLAADNAEDKATDIQDAIDAETPTCFTTSRSVDEVTLDAGAGNRIVLIDIQDDDTNETIGAQCTSADAVKGKTSFSGSAGGGSASVSVGAVTAQTTTNGKTTSQIMQELVTSLTSQGVPAVLTEREIVITGDVAGVLFSSGNSDTGLTLRLQLERATLPVGGLAELPGVVGSSGPNYVLLAGLAAAAVVALAAGGWYARRRWVR